MNFIQEKWDLNCKNLSKNADVRVEFELDKNLGITRKIETHKIITEYTYDDE